MDNQIVKRTVIYEGLFVLEHYNDIENGGFDGTRIKTEPFRYSSLNNPICYPHVTVAYKPEVTHEELYGTEISIIVKGYGNDGINEGYLVEFVPYFATTKGDKFSKLCELLSNIEIPHITISISDEGKPVNTSKLKFEKLPMDKQFVLDGEFGAFVEEEYSDGTKVTDFYGLRH